MKSKAIRIQVVALATVVLLAFMLPAAFATGENPFYDVSSDDAYYDAVLYCYDNGIVEGMSETEFAPDKTLTRAMFVTLLGRVAENMRLETKGYTSSFQDVQKDSWYDTYVGWAAAKEFVNGMSKTRFAPEQSVTREQAVVIVIRFAEKLGLKLDTTLGVEFADRDAVSAWAKTQMDKAIGAGLAIGASEGLLRPQQPATRAEIVMMLHTLCERYIGDIKMFEIYGEYRRTIDHLPLNNYINENFQASGSFRSYVDDEIVSMQGVDLSYHQGKIDWPRVRAAGVEFAMLRVGGRGYGIQTGGSIFADTQFEANIKGALENDIHVGVYFFSQAISVEEALEEARYVLSKIEGYDVRFPVVFDWENITSASRTDNISSKTLTDCAIAFCDAVAEAGYIPMIYFNNYISMNLYDMGRLGDYDFWLAQYRATPDYPYHFTMWQYTDKGRVDGISESVDMNISFVDYSAR